jgi:hypothetical protein
MNFRPKILILPFRPQDMICRRRQQLERRKGAGVRATRVLREPVSAREEARRRCILQGKSYMVSPLVAARQVLELAHHLAHMLGHWAIEPRLSRMLDANDFIYGTARTRRNI